MKQRPIKNHERILIQHLLELIKVQIPLPQMVADLDENGMQSIRLTSNPETKYSHDLIQAKFLDDDNLLVLITLTESNTSELFELEFKKVYSNQLINYPAPGQVKHSIKKILEPSFKVI